MLITVDIGRLQRGGRSRHHPARALRGPGQQHPGAVPRSRRPLVRAVPARAHRLRVQGPGAGPPITYEGLADPKWKGKICTRSFQHQYNIALVAAFIVKHGEAKTEEWLRGVKANLAKKPSGGDRDVAKDIMAGVCDIGLGNQYYIGLMSTARAEQKKWAEAVQA